MLILPLLSGEENAIMEQLTTDLMVKVLDYMDIPSRVKLVQSNLNLQQQVYRECSSYSCWETIDFRHAASCRERLTDLALSQLLMRVNAKEITKNLNLFGCRKIHGSGLMPLKNSQVLERVAFGGRTAVDQDATVVLSILRGSMPFNLFEVKLGRLDRSFNRHSTIEFMRHLREAKMAKAEREGTLCHGWLSEVCGEPQSTAAQTVTPFCGVPFTHCLDCNRDFCRNGSCTMGVRDCDMCEKTSCDECSTVGKCEDCGRSTCLGATHSEGDLSKCHKCEKLSCSFCDDVQVCRECENTSDVCTGPDCLFRDDCWAGKANCTSCNGRICIGCSDFCAECDKCQKKYCIEGPCRQHVEECGVCYKHFCIECEGLEHCGGCDTKFCRLHQKLVDCEACNMHHCRACNHVKRCRFCDKACFEDCTCHASGQPSPKRAKMTL